MAYTPEQSAALLRATVEERLRFYKTYRDLEEMGASKAVLDAVSPTGITTELVSMKGIFGAGFLGALVWLVAIPAALMAFLRMRRR